ncbi:hypothetical protein Tco_0262306 [Tanacetum coccineum]
MSNDRVFCLPCTCERCRRNYTDIFCSICCFESGNAFIDDLITNSFDDLPNSSDHPPQPQTHSFESNGDPPQVPFISNPDPCYNQNFDNNFPQTSPSFPQQYLCCTRCGGPHETFQCQQLIFYEPEPCYNQNFDDTFPQNSPNFQQQILCCENCGGPHESYQCQPMNQNYYDPNLCYNSNSSGFDQYQPPQYSVTHQPPQEKSMAELLLEEKLPQALQALCERLNKYVQKKQEEKNIAEEQAAKISSQYWKPPIYYDNDDDEEYSIQVSEFFKKSPIAITPVLPTIEPEDSLSMGDEHLSTIPEKESDKVIKSSVENLVPIPSESKDLTDYESECDMPVCDDSSSKNEGLDDIVSIPPGKEIDHLDAIPDSVQSLLNRANSIIFLIEEFTGKLAPIDPIPPGIVEADPEEDIRLIEKLLNDDSSPHSPEELNSEIPDAIIESFSPSPIPVEDSDSLMEEIDIFLASDDSIPSGIKNDDYDSEGGGVLFLAELLNNDYISLPEYESFHVDFYNVPSSPRPPEKPPDDDVYFNIEPDTGVLTTKVVDDISDNLTRELYVHVPNVLPTLPTLYLVFNTLLPFSFENEDKVFNPEFSLKKGENLLSSYLIGDLKLSRSFMIFLKA